MRAVKKITLWLWGLLVLETAYFVASGIYNHYLEEAYRDLDEVCVTFNSPLSFVEIDQHWKARHYDYGTIGKGEYCDPADDPLGIAHNQVGMLTYSNGAGR